MAQGDAERQDRPKENHGLVPVWWRNVWSWGPLVLAVGILAPGPSGAQTPAPLDTLEVVRDPHGGIRATAHLLLPAKTQIIHDLLTDYARWPELFDVRMRLAELTVENGIATVDLRIAHPLLPGERRLVTESRLLPGGGVVTELKGGDFKRYHRVWTLRQASDGNWTVAEFELVFELDSLVPDWIVLIAVRQELEAHFRILKQKAVGRSEASF